MCSVPEAKVPQSMQPENIADFLVRNVKRLVPAAGKEFKKTYPKWKKDSETKEVVTDLPAPEGAEGKWKIAKGADDAIIKKAAATHAINSTLKPTILKEFRKEIGPDVRSASADATTDLPGCIRTRARRKIEAQMYASADKALGDAVDSKKDEMVTQVVASLDQA